MKHLSLVAFAVIFLAGCAQSTTNTYKAGDVGHTIDVSEGKIVSSRLVNIEADDPVAGPLVGAGVGAATGGLLIGSGSGSAAAAIIGGLIGAGAGYVIEKEARGGEGIEYIVRLSDGRVVTLVQNRENNEPALADGSPVLIQWGGEYTRVVSLPEQLESPSGGGSGGGGADVWTNPDESYSGEPYEEAPPPYPPSQQQQ